MGRIFVSGVGTEVGKTFFCAVLLRKFKGMGTFYFKPVETGGRKPQDYSLCSKIADFSEPPVYHFYAPASPHLSAKLSKKKIQISKIKRKLEDIGGKYGVVIEGAGGLLVPLTDNPLYTWADLIAEFKIPLIIVASSYLGVINHTLMTVEVAEKRKINVVGVVLNYQRKPKTIAEKTNEQVLKKILGEKFLGSIPFSPSQNFDLAQRLSRINWKKIKNILFS
ncbi:ATP-dependent dethiobiotin synthetase BioD 1 [bacterium HR19]|nr:ATP-dependent dethiobiotin synthetase BioD 1 [bacterium HR19]